MRRSLPLACLLAALFLLAPSIHAEDEAPARKGLSPEQVARMILLGGEAQQAFAAQYLERADVSGLRAVQRALRTLAPVLAEQMKAEAPGADAASAPAPKTIVTLQTRVLEAEGGDAFLRDLGVFELGERGFTYLDDTQQEVLLRAAEKSERIQSLTAPRITVYDRQRANVSMLSQVSYVKDYEVEVAQDRFIADPIVGIVQDGMTLDVRPVVSADRRYVALEVDVTWAHLRRPMKERKVVLHDGAEPVTIQLPELDVGGAHANAMLPTGATILLVSPAVFGTAKDAKTRFVLVTATIVDLPAEDK